MRKAWISARKDACRSDECSMDNRLRIISTVLSCAAGTALLSSNSVATTVQTKEEIARARSMIQKGIEVGKHEKTSRWIKIAAKVRPFDYVYLVEHDPDAQF